jgi:hypothetical protein
MTLAFSLVTGYFWALGIIVFAVIAIGCVAVLRERQEEAERERQRQVTEGALLESGMRLLRSEPIPDGVDMPDPIDVSALAQRDLGRIEGLKVAKRLLGIASEEAKRMQEEGEPVLAVEAIAGTEQVLDDHIARGASALGVRRTICCANYSPLIVCICGSTRFAKEMNEEADRLTRAGLIVVRPEVITYDAGRDPQRVNPALKERLDRLHLHKIDLCDEVFVVNVEGYIGDSTRREIAYAKDMNRPVSYLVEPEPEEDDAS